MAIEYTFFKKAILESVNEVKKYKEWLEKELMNTNKLWANFHRFFYANYLVLRLKVPAVVRYRPIDGREEPDNAYNLNEYFESRCPFDEDSHYRIYYMCDTPVDVAELPEKWAPPYGGRFYSVDFDRELTVTEFCAYVINEICQRNLKEVSQIIKYAEDPKEFCYEMIGNCKRINDEVGVKLWSFAMRFEESPFETPKVDITTSSYRRYVGI